MVNILLTFLAVLFIVFGSIGAITQIVSMLGCIIAKVNFQTNNLPNVILVSTGVTILLLI